MPSTQLPLLSLPDPVPQVSDLCTEYKVVATRHCMVAEAAATLDAPPVLAKFARSLYESAPWYDPDKEAVVVIMLDCKHRTKGFNLVSLGTLTNSLLTAREVFRPAIASAAAAIAIVHNHPSGDCAPSTADIAITRQLREASKILGIELVDHVILGDASRDPLGLGFYSFREAGII